MTDKREDIILALNAVATALVIADGHLAEFAMRNAEEAPENKRPCIIVLDADETVDEMLNPYGKGKPTVKQIPLAMSPEIYVILQDIGDGDIGAQLNAWRAKVIKAIMTDTALNSLCHEIRYEGFTTALAQGRSMEGQAKLHFSFIYMLRPDQL